MNYADAMWNKELTVLKKDKPQFIKPECKGSVQLSKDKNEI